MSVSKIDSSALKDNESQSSSLITEQILTKSELNDINNIINTKKIITKSENPNPLIIIVIIVAMVILFYLVYVTQIKNSLEGRWYDDNDKVYFIDHCKFKDILVVSSKNSNVKGIVKDDIVILFYKNTTKLGIYLNNCIKWTDNTTWCKILLR